MRNEIRLNVLFCNYLYALALVQEMKDNKESGRDNALMFFEKEYVLDHLIATADTPIISILDGICSEFIHDFL